MRLEWLHWVIPSPSWQRQLAVAGIAFGMLLLLTPAQSAEPAALPQSSDKARNTQRQPRPLPDHPGNVFVEGEEVTISPPLQARPSEPEWRLLDDRHQGVRHGTLPAKRGDLEEPLRLGKLPIGWYRLEFPVAGQTNLAWTTLAVLAPLRALTPALSPIAVDSATAWFARDNAVQQRRLASLAALAGVYWIRDRLRWADIQPKPGPLKGGPTTYDTAADAQWEAGLQVLQVFHDTPAWARAQGESGGRFAPDLRRVHELARNLASRFKGRVAGWEPWNEANVATFGGHTVDQMCAWQKAAWLGFKAGDPEVLVGWNATAAVPTPEHTRGVLANETWPYFDTYNIHSYDGPEAYLDLWRPAREAAAGRPLWITEADRGTPHLKNPPWFDQEPRLERLKAEWMAQAYASSLFAGAQRHFHFILGNYQEPNGVQFGLLRYDLTPRPAYVALAALGRCLAGAQPLGRWQPGNHIHLYAFRARPGGELHDVLVLWTEKAADWDGRGNATAPWPFQAQLKVQEVVDYLGRSHGTNIPAVLKSAPVFVLLPAGEAAKLPLEAPPPQLPWREGKASPVVLQVCLPPALVTKVEDLPWSEGHAYRVSAGQSVEFGLHVYNFTTNRALGKIEVAAAPNGWTVSLPTADVSIQPGERAELAGKLDVPSGCKERDGWVVLRAKLGEQGSPVSAFRLLIR